MLTESPTQRPDRLTSLLDALAPHAVCCAPDDPAAVLLVIGGDTTTVLRLCLAGQGGEESSRPDRILAALRIDFASSVASVFGRVPERIDLTLACRPQLAALVGILVAEAAGERCGGGIAQALLGSTLLLLALREVIETQPPDEGLLAGLAEPRLHRALVAIHERPRAPWTTEALAAEAGMSRSRFIEAFARVMGTTPGVYLRAWRLRHAGKALRAGRPVKEAAALAGFSSTAAFSRAFRRAHGQAPSRSFGGRAAGASPCR